MTEARVIADYQAGASQYLLSLRSRKPVTWVVAVLTSAGIPLRSHREAIAVSNATRAENKAIRERRIVVFPPGATGRRRRA